MLIPNLCYTGSVIRPENVHSFASGIGTTSTDQTRDWLLQNILVASDEYSTDLAANMTRCAHTLLINNQSIQFSAEKQSIQLQLTKQNTKQDHQDQILHRRQDQEGLVHQLRPQMEKSINWDPEPASHERQSHSLCIGDTQ